MIVLIYVLGLDILYYNQIVLWFFNDELVVDLQVRRFMIVGDEVSVCDGYLVLDVICYLGKKLLVQVVIVIVKVNCQQCFFFYGQFNIGLWLVLLSGGICLLQFNWYIWGVDLYENFVSLKFCLFYLLCCMVQGWVGCVFVICGDFSWFVNCYLCVLGELFYFLICMDLVLNILVDNVLCGDILIILVGNFGDCSNEYIVVLKVIYQQFGDMVNVIVLMGYLVKNDVYINEVCEVGVVLFSGEYLQIFSEKLEFYDYLVLLCCCDLGYFLFVCQQGIGILCLLIQVGIFCVFNWENLFWQDMVEQYVLVLFISDVLDVSVVCEVQCQLVSVDKFVIVFFWLNYLMGWWWVLWLVVEGQV